MKERIAYHVGAHEPIFHRLRTGNTTAQEWERWRYETSKENLETLGELGVSSAQIACSKGFGLEYEKPLIERAARFAEAAAKYGIATSVYFQGFPVYYETFLLELPHAVDWLGRQQNGDFIPWGGQTFRRYVDPACLAFREYQRKILEYIFALFKPAHLAVDNPTPPPSWTDMGRESFRGYLRSKYTQQEAEREFGIPSFDAVDLPRFDPIYYPPDAHRIVKDPLLQEWARWQSATVTEYLIEHRDFIRSRSPETSFTFNGGCDLLRYNALFSRGIDLDERLEKVGVNFSMEESFWRPGVVVQAGQGRVVMDERHPDQARQAEGGVRISTDARFPKIKGNYGFSGRGGFWGEVDRPSKLVALSHTMTFAREASNFGVIGPLAASRQMLDDVRDVIDWGDRHIDVLVGRESTIAPIALWRGNSTLAFIRHTPVWEACAVEQMLFEHHLPFTIVFDAGLEKFLAGRQVLVLPGTQCVSDRQVEIITEFVRGGGKLLLLGPAGTRDERARLRRSHAFEHLFGGSIPSLEYFGPPHWVPELDWSAMPNRLTADLGKGKVVLVKSITPAAPLDMTRDPYMPERQVAAKDIVPPANEAEIMGELSALAGSMLRAEGPRWTLAEYWKRGGDLLVCLCNLHSQEDGGPVTVHLGPHKASDVTVHTLLESGASSQAARDGKVTIPALKHFCVIEAKGVL